ncbi:MAG: hypothetical protein ACJAST_000514 [Halopseudomonas sp.]|jgi:hypothetical protein
MHALNSASHSRSTPLRELLAPQALQELAERSAGNEKRRKSMTTVNVVKP